MSDKEKGLPADAVNEDDSFLLDLNPTDHLIGVVDTAEVAGELLSELDDVGFGRDDVQVFVGSEGARQIDPWGKEHGLVSMLKRLIQMTHADFDFEHYYADEAEAGHYVIAVHCPEDEERAAAQELMTRHEARNLFYFGTFQFEEIPLR